MALMGQTLSRGKVLSSSSGDIYETRVYIVYTAGELTYLLIF
jgi:hypothetical protein